MAGLLDRPTSDAPETTPPAGEAAPDAPQPEAPVRTCATCHAALADGQDWCLECGSAQPGRLGGRPGWRAALTVLAVTGVLVGGAAAAAYAALTSDAQRDARASAPPAAAPLTQPAPIIEAPAPAPTTETPADEGADDLPKVEAPDSDDADVPAPGDLGDDSVDVSPSPSPTPSPTPAPTPTPTPSDDATGGTDTGTGDDTTTETTPAEPVAIDLPGDAGSVYDPFKRAVDKAGDPADALDGKSTTAFELPVAPDGTVRAGLTVSLEKATVLSDLEIKADTPGFTVEIYATKEPEIPPDILDARWEHVANRRDADVEEKVSLDGKYRHVLLWFTEQPADSKVAIPEIQIFD